MIPDSATNDAVALAAARAMTPDERARSREAHDLATRCPAWKAAHRAIAGVETPADTNPPRHGLPQPDRSA